MKEILLSAEDISKVFGMESEAVPVLDHVTVDIYKDDFTVIMGPSGAGKSTLLYTLSGMDDVSAGKVVYKGQVISQFKERQMADIRSHEFGFVFQQTHLVSNLTLFENVAVAGYCGKSGKGETEKEIRQRAETLLEQMNVGYARQRLPSEVSGGEAQRAAIARAMIHEPGIIFADEPTGALNRQNTGEVLDLLTALNKEGQSILMVTHDVHAAARGSRLLYLEDGKIVDELIMPMFNSCVEGPSHIPSAEGEERTRESRINDWLSSFQW